jgi:hypothetical protein
MRALRPLLAAVALVVVMLGARAAQAFPQYQFSTGVSRCDQCHFAPAGGGLINTFGRDAVSDELTTFGGNGAFLHGAVRLPAWLALGGDFRGAFASEDVQDPNGEKNAVFPMQADAQARLAYGPLSFYGVLGFRGQVRSDSDVIPLQNYQPIDVSQLISREHYFMLRASPLGAYVRAGRFFAPFGLRMAEHFLYVRRDLGFNTLEETYNLSSGYVAEGWEVHITAFAPDFIRHIGSREGGVAGYGEVRFADRAAVGLQARVADGPGMVRTTGGALGKYWLEPLRTLFLAEADFVRRDVDAVGPSYQFIGMGGLSVLPVKGVMATVLQEHEQVDLRDSGTTYDATSVLLNWFPYAHCEVQGMARFELPNGGQWAKTFFIQLHYFL